MNRPVVYGRRLAPDGTLRVWGDRRAEDREDALARYDHRFYKANHRLSSSGSNLGVLAGV